MENTTIGLMLPSSTIMPMAKDFERGVKEGLKGLKEEGFGQPEIVMEFIDQGGRETVDKAIGKLLSFDHADILTGIFTNRVLPEVADKFDRYGKPLLLNNLGEHQPVYLPKNDYVFINSGFIWQQVWSLANWAIKNLGKKGMLVAGIYDAGYPFMRMIREGFDTDGSTAEIPFSIARIREGSKLADPSMVIEQIIAFKPDFVFSFFCGEEASLFLEAYIQAGLHKKIPLLGLPFLIEPYKGSGEEVEIYTAAITKDKTGEDLIKNGCAAGNKTFWNLGIETGLLIADAIRRSNGSGLAGALRNSQVKSDRGSLNIASDAPGKGNKAYIIRTRYAGDPKSMHQEVVTEHPTMQPDQEQIKKSMQEPVSGWLNPYLGI